MNIKNLFKREAAASQVEKTSTAGGKAAFDIKRFFKSKPPAQKSAVPHDRAPRPEHTKLAIIVLLVLLLLASGAAYLLLPEVADPVNELLGISDVQPAPSPVPPPRAAPVPNMAMVSAASGVSAVVSASAVSAVSGVASAPISGVVSAPTSGVMAVSAVASAVVTASQVPEPVIAMPDMPELPAATSGVEDAPPPHRASQPTRPRNRDIRHCLELKTNEAIMRCAYPKR